MSNVWVLTCKHSRESTVICAFDIKPTTSNLTTVTGEEWTDVELECNQKIVGDYGYFHTYVLEELPLLPVGTN